MLQNVVRYTVLPTAIVLVFAPSALGWGKTGHRIGGEIAADYLNEDAQAAITAILGSENLAEASSWPDFMRSSADAFWQGDSRTWHYVTILEGEVYGDNLAPESGDAITALGGFRDTLRNLNAKFEEQALALRFAVHIIGDLHQPLHAGNGTDRGGNDHEVIWFGASTNLHSVWDTKLIEDQRLSYTEYADWLGRRITPELASEWNSADPIV